MMSVPRSRTAMTATTVAVIAASARRAADRRHRAPGRRSRLLTVLAVIIGMIPIGFGATPALAAGIAPAALWRTNGQATPRYATWDGASFGGSQASATAGEFRIMQGAESPSRDEAIVVGVDAGGTISGEMWNGSAWAALPALGTTTQTYWWGFDVAYEPVSGDAVVVYADGANLNYRQWDGSTWSGEISIPEPPGGTPRQMQLAAHPYSDEMVLIVSNDSSQDYAVVWDGSTWGNAVTLSAVGTGNDRTDVNVAYEQQSGDALVVYGKGVSNVSYRTWNGSAWSGETSVLAPGGVTGVSRWTALASDPATDRIVMGVVTYGSEIWMMAWSGASWISPVVATTSAASTSAPVVAAAFEGTSGQALVAYSMSSQNAVQYRTWSSGGGWSGALSGPSSSGIPNSVMLYPEPSTDGVMLAAQDANSDLSYTYWNGGGWGSPSVLETNSGETKNQPFLFLWPGTVGSPPPTYTISGTVFEDVAGDVLNDGAIGGASNPGVQDTDVHLYLDVDGDGVTEATDTYMTTVPTDANGDYSFPGLSNGKYFVVVDSKTVRSTAPALSSNDVWAEQTYGPAVSECADGSGGTVNDPTPGSCYGGRRAGVSDNLTTWYSGSEHLAKISIASADKSNIDFGFSFNVVTSTAGGNAQDDDLRSTTARFKARCGSSSPTPTPSPAPTSCASCRPSRPMPPMAPTIGGASP